MRTLFSRLFRHLQADDLVLELLFGNIDEYSCEAAVVIGLFRAPRAPLPVRPSIDLCSPSRGVQNFFDVPVGQKRSFPTRGIRGHRNLGSGAGAGACAGVCGGSSGRCLVSGLFGCTDCPSERQDRGEQAQTLPQGTFSLSAQLGLTKAVRLCALYDGRVKPRARTGPTESGWRL